MAGLTKNLKGLASNIVNAVFLLQVSAEIGNRGLGWHGTRRCSEKMGSALTTREIEGYAFIQGKG